MNSGYCAGTSVHFTGVGPNCGPPQTGPSSNWVPGRAVAVFNSTDRSSSLVKMPSARGPEGTRPAGPEATTPVSLNPVSRSPRMPRASRSSLPAPPATKGVAPEVPPATVSPDTYALLRTAAHAEQESATTCGENPGQVFM